MVANLPFALTSDICRALLSDPLVALRSADFVVQWDAAVKRTRLWPSTVVGVLWGAWYELSIARRLAPAAFAPPPSVAAAVLQARRRPDPLVPPAHARAYASFVRRAYRSGSLPRTARSLAPLLGFDPNAAPRDLGPREWARLWQEASARARTVTQMTRRRRTR